MFSMLDMPAMEVNGLAPNILPEEEGPQEKRQQTQKKTFPSVQMKRIW
jgi:hypothetical protein